MYINIKDIYIYMKSSFPKRDKRQSKKSVSNVNMYAYIKSSFPKHNLQSRYFGKDHFMYICLICTHMEAYIYIAYIYIYITPTAVKDSIIVTNQHRFHKAPGRYKRTRLDTATM